MATVEDVARRAGVATATVSRVVNDHPHVSEEMRKRVKRAIRELHYVPDRTARNLRTRQANVIGLVISDIRNPFYPEISRGIEDAAYKRKYAVLLGNTNWERARERLYLETLLAERASGVIISPTAARSDVVRRIVRFGVPVVAIDRKFSSPVTDVVRLDNVAAMALAVDHLVSLGHRRFGALAGPSTIETAAERVSGFQAALERHSIKLDSRMMHRTTVDEAEVAATSILKLRPTALIAGNSGLALAVLRAARALGIRMPDDLSLLGIDDPAWAEALSVPLTVIAQPTYDLGERAAQLLFSRIDGDRGAAQDVRMPPELRIRESTGPAPHRR